MAWTGLPVVNRILANSRLYKNPIAALSGDVSNVNAIMTWVVLMYLIPYAENSQDPYKALAIFNAVLAVFILFWWILDIVMTRIARMATTSESLSQLSVLLTFCMVFFFSWFTQAMGAHAIFGALLVGLRTPHNSIKIAEKMEDILMILFVPIYYGLVGVLATIAFIK
jgi:Kef-type K+ transport system membrane component KefB